MAVAYVNSTSNKGNVSSLSLTVPTGGSNGDLLLFCVTNYWPQSWGTPSGLTLAVTGYCRGVVAYVYYRIVQAGDPTSYAFTQANSTLCSGVCLRYSGVDQSVPVRFFSTNNSDSSGLATSIVMPQMLNVGAGDMCVGLVSGGSGSNNQTTTPSTPAGWNARQSLTQNQAGNKSVATAGFDKLAATDTPTSTGFSGRYNSCTVCLAAAGDSTPTITRSAPVFQSSTAAASNNNTTSFVITAPSGVSDGDLLIAAVCTTLANTHTITGGWTQLFRTTPSVSNTIDATGTLWYRVAASEPASYTLGVSPGDGMSAFILRYSGTDPSNPIRIVNGGGLLGTASSTSIAAPSVMPQVQGNELILDVYGTGSDAQVAPPDTITPPGSGWVTRAATATTYLSDFQTAIAAVEQYAAVDFPTASAVYVGGWIVFSVALVGLPVSTLLWKPRLGPNYRR